MVHTILIILAIICFVIAAAGDRSPTRGINLGWVGLALWALTALV